MKLILGSIAAAMVTTMGSAAYAAIAYVDASSSNTVMAASVSGPVGPGGALVTNTTDSVDAIWRLRTGLGVAPTATTPPAGAGAVTTGGSGTVLESTGNNTLNGASDNVPRLRTSVSGLAPGLYDVFVYFWTDQNGSPWTIRAGLTDDTGPLTQYGAGTPSVQIATDTSGRRLYEVNLGETSGTSINVFVEDLPATTGNTRTWYDGIGYEAVPEPASWGVLGAGVLLTSIRRRHAL